MSNMKTVLIIHLSDLHILVEDAPKWSQGKAEKIARSACRSGPHSQVIIIISGDIAYGGSTSEYCVAESFLNSVVLQAEKLVGCSVKLVLAPGNHDCDFSEKSKLRELARILTNNETVDDSEMLEKLAAPLANYRAFESRVESFHFHEKNLLQKNGVFEFDDFKIQIRVFISPLYSSKNERKGELFLPPSLIESGWQDDCFRVVVMHHPTSWFVEDAGRPVRTALRAHAHLVLYGHEHIPEISQITTPMHGVATEVIEVDGAVLSQHGNSDQSSFITFKIDEATNAVEPLQHEWQSTIDCYVTSSLAACARGTGWIGLPRKASAYALRTTFQEKIRDPGIAISPRAGKYILAKDLYVFPELAEPIKVGSAQEAIFTATRLLSPEEILSGIVIQGDEKAGKTALLYRLFETYHQAGYVPLYVSLRDHKIKSGKDFEKIIATSILDIYSGLTVDAFFAVPKDRRVYLFDDIDALTKPSIRDDLVAVLKTQAAYFAATTTMRPELTEVLTGDSSGTVGNIRQVKISKMSSVMRGKLINNWVVNVELTSVADGEVFVARIDHLEKSAVVTLGHNLVPRVPHMLLIFLQSSSASSHSKLESGALAHYYQFLVAQYLLAVGVKSEDLDEPISFARIVSYTMHRTGKDYITREELEKCNSQFGEEFIPGSLNARLNMLTNAKLLLEFGSDSYKWREPYAYYLFLGGYLSRNLENPQVRAAVTDMVSHLYVRTNANALLFLVHDSKDTQVFRDITNVIEKLFSKNKPLKLGEDTKEFGDFIRNANALIQPTCPMEMRERRNAERDVRRDTNGDGDGLAERRNNSDALSELEEITVLFKTSEILGQVLKEQYASIPRSTREPIVVALLEAYLRGAGGLIRKMALNKSLLQKWIEKQFVEQGETMDDGERAIAAQSFVAQLVQMFMFGFFQKLAESIASDKTLDLVRNIKWPDSLEPKVLSLACELNVQRSIPFGQIDSILKAAEGDPAFVALVRNLVQMRISLFHTKATELQALASRFKIGVQKLNTIDFIENKKR